MRHIKIIISLLSAAFIMHTAHADSVTVVHIGSVYKPYPCLLLSDSTIRYPIHNDVANECRPPGLLPIPDIHALTDSGDFKELLANSVDNLKSTTYDNRGFLVFFVKTNDEEVRRIEMGYPEGVAFLKELVVYFPDDAKRINLSFIDRLEIRIKVLRDTCSKQHAGKNTMRQVFHTYPWIHPDESPEIKAIYEKYGHLRRIRKGEVLKSAYALNHLSYLKSGLCAYYINFNMEKPRVLSLIVPGRVMGDITCVTKERVNVTVKAMRNSEFLSISPHVLLDEMHANADTSLRVTRSIIKKQESHLEGMIANFMLSPEQRLQAFIKVLLLTHEQYVAQGWSTVPLVLSHEEYGEVTNITRVSVSRIFSKWKHRECLRKEGRILQVHSDLFSQLYDWVDFYQTK